MLKKILTRWWPVFLISFSAFIFNTNEFLPIGLLPDIANSLNISISKAGLLITIYAWSVTIISLPLTILFNKFDRKTLVVIILIVFTVAQVFSSISWNFYSLLSARLLIVFSHAIFWSISIPLVTKLVPNYLVSKALVVVMIGSTLSIVFGIPISTYIGHITSWRISFLIIGIISLLIVLIIVFTFPKIKSEQSSTIKNISVLLKNPMIQMYYFLTLGMVTSYFTFYSYIMPYMQKVASYSSNKIIIILFIIGIAGIFSSIIYSKFSMKYFNFLFISSIVNYLIIFIIIDFLLPYYYYILIICFLLGFAEILFSLCLQYKILQLASKASDIGMSLFSSIFNIGIGMGAFIGGVVINKVSLSYINYFSFIIVVFTLIIILFVTIFYKYYENRMKL